MVTVKFEPQKENFSVICTKEAKEFTLDQEAIVAGWEANIKAMIYRKLKDIENSGTELIQKELLTEDRIEIVDEVFSRLIDSMTLEEKIYFYIEQVISVFGYDEFDNKE